MIPLATVVGLVVDQVLGEPPSSLHPVAWYGTFMQRAEHLLYRDERRRGVMYLAIGMSTAAAVGLSANRLLGRPAATALATGLCAAGQMLDREALAIAAHLDSGDVEAARLRLRSLVGRTTDDLDEPAISRAVIESIAENSVDAVTATAFWAAIGGAPAALAHRAINTLDAMVGHRSTRYECFGWASARLDDAVNYLPARLGAVMVSVVRPARARSVLRVVRRDAGAHPSPNGGVIESTYAAALGCQLGGINRYESGPEDRGTLGDGAPPHRDQIRAAVTLRRHSTLALGLTFVGFAMRTMQLTPRRPQSQ